MQGSWRQVRDRESINDFTTDGESEFPASASAMSKVDMVSDFEGQMLLGKQGADGRFSNMDLSKPPRISGLDRISTQSMAISPNAKPRSSRLASEADL